MAVRFCNRCNSKISFISVSPGYFGVCLKHDEDLYKFETYEKGKK